ncbi:hypothetical protein [uncultured Tateyamaria sp.]|uniref:hypothetical protein n=1 Tax=uncultured Tateyamaria sp. TaxID=455651 RepID=UPI002604D640|nr:hypothetical protein [uncultured Tateyamaria sp.]
MNSCGPRKEISYYTRLEVAFGACFGILGGAAFGDASTWIALGLGLGLVIGNRFGVWKQRRSRDEGE